MTIIDELMVSNGIQLRGSGRYAVHDLTLLYIFRGLTCAAYKKKMSAFVDHEMVLPFKRSVLGNGYLMKHIKLWLLAVANGQRGTDFGVEREDKILSKGIERHRPLGALLRRLGKQYRVFDLDTFDRVLESVICELDDAAYIIKFVHRKMRFITTAQALEPKDVVLDILCSSMTSMYHQYPQYESRLHFTNLFKKFIRNEGINFIKAYTAEKRSRIVADVGGSFINNTSDISVAQLDPLNAEALSVNFHGELDCDRDLKIGVQQLMQSVSGKRRRFIELMMGNEDAMFSEWLTTKRVTVTNDLLFERCLMRGQMDRYVSLVLAYLDVGQAAGQRFMDQIRDSLKDYA